MSVVKRLNIVRETEDLNKAQFERKLSKSSGYLNMLTKRDSNPGVDVLATFAEKFPNYSLEWLLTGKGEMLKSENTQPEKTKESSTEYRNMIIEMSQKIRADLKGITEGMTENFTTLHNGVFHILKDTQELKDFTNEVDLPALKSAGKDLKELLKQRG